MPNQRYKDKSGITKIINSVNCSTDFAPSFITTCYTVRHEFIKLTTTENTSGDDITQYKTDCITTLIPSGGSALPTAVTAIIGSAIIEQGIDYTYDSIAGKITVFGAKIADIISITASITLDTVLTIDPNLLEEKITVSISCEESSFDHALTALSFGDFRLQDYFSEANGGIMVTDVGGIFVRDNDYVDTNGKWKYSIRTLTVYAQ